MSVPVLIKYGFELGWQGARIGIVWKDGGISGPEDVFEIPLVLGWANLTDVWNAKELTSRQKKLFITHRS